MSRVKDFINKFRPVARTTSFVGAPSFRYKNPYMLDCYDEDRYASIYPSIKAISNEFMKVRPFAIDSNGKPQENVPSLDALYHPNQLDSAVSFREKLAVMNLTHRNTYVLVWRREGSEAKPGGELGFNNIAGFTFLENPAIDRRDNRTFYKMGAQEFSENEVIVIPGGVDPNGLYAGYAPGIASARWATLDEYIADFQKGFFENGAVPAGQFVITAASKQDFDDTVDKLQESHRGASRNNNVTYTPRPVDPNDGKPAQAKIEWIPFQQSNKEIDFKSLFEQANKRIDSTFGVPASIRGVGENNNYATARMDQQNFIRFTIEPLALRIYSQITHELNRITGGLGVAITFKLDYPAVAEEEKAQAETKKLEVDAILQLTDKGFSLDSIVDSLKLSNSYKNLKVGGVNTKIENDKPDVDEGDEVNKSPDPDKIDGITPLGKESGKELVIPIPKAKLSDEEKLEEAAKGLMRSQIDRAVTELKDEPSALEEPTKDELDEFIRAMMSVISGILLKFGTDEYAVGVELANLNIDDLQGFMLTETAEDSYKQYLRRVGSSYGIDSAESIRKVLLESRDNELNRRETEAKLRDILNTDDYRVKRLARTELNNSQNIGKLEGMKSLSDETNTTWEKTIDHSNGNPCPLCASQEGEWTAIEQPLWAEGASITATDDKGERIVYVNDWQTLEASDYHPNGKGVLLFRRIEA